MQCFEKVYSGSNGVTKYIENMLGAYIMSSTKEMVRQQSHDIFFSRFCAFQFALTFVFLILQSVFGVVASHVVEFATLTIWSLILQRENRLSTLVVAFVDNKVS